MTREEINEYVKKYTGEPIELKSINDSIYVKFDFLPYALREFIHTSKDYDHSKMINSERDCGCGHAYFLEENIFYNLVNKYSPV